MKAVAFLPTTNVEIKMFIEFLEEVQKNVGGRLKIKFLGGPEVMSSREQIDGLQSGVVQIAMIPQVTQRKCRPSVQIT